MHTRDLAATGMALAFVLSTVTSILGCSREHFPGALSDQAPKKESVPAALTTPGSIRCTAIDADGLAPLHLAMADAQGKLAALPPPPESDAFTQAAGALATGIGKVDAITAWLQSDGLDASNVSAAWSIASTLEEAVWSLEEATRLVVGTDGPAAPDAVMTFVTSATSAATRANDLHADAGRCYRALDAAMPTVSDPGHGPIPVRTACSDLGVPLLRDLAALVGRAQADSRAPELDPEFIYVKLFNDHADQTTQTLAAAITELSGSGNDASDRVAARTMHEALTQSAKLMVSGNQWSLAAAGHLDSLAMRSAFERGTLATEVAVMAAKRVAACVEGVDTTQADLIQSIIADRTSLCIGDSVTLTVTTVHPDHPNGRVDVSTIHGKGPVETFPVYGAPGTHTIHVAAETPEHYQDQKTIDIALQYCPEAVFPTIAVRASTEHPKAIDFVVTNSKSIRRADAQYQWAFGDGTVTTTDVPFVTHEYAIARTDRDKPFVAFEMAVTVHTEGEDDVSARRSVDVQNLYGFAKAHGTITPSVSPAVVQLQGSAVTARYTIQNLEDSPLAFVSRQVTYRLCAPLPSGDESRVGPSENDAFSVPPDGALEHSVVVSLPPDACDVRIEHWGPGIGGHEAVAVASASVRPRKQRKIRVTDAQTILALTQAAASGLVADRTNMSSDELRRLQLSGVIDMPVRADDPAPATVMALQGGLDDLEDGTQLGDYCIKGQTPPPGTECRVTDEWWTGPAEVDNGFKGDVFMTPGCGLVGNLVRALSPSQYYSHSGIFTRDYYRVRHSTAAEERPEDYPLSGSFDLAVQIVLVSLGIPSDGFEEHAVRYGWPGTITQSIRGIIEGTAETDPRKPDKKYTIKAFGIHPEACPDLGDTHPWYPILLKPVPRPGSNARGLARAAADKSTSIHSHYRFYSYSRGNIALDGSFDLPSSQLPEASSFGHTTNGAVCSSLIWNSYMAANIPVEGALEDSDKNDGAELGPLPQDGMYHYTAKERVAAGEALSSMISSKVWKELVDSAGGDVGALIIQAATEISSDVANQMTNCFASDRCDPDARKDSNWQQTGDGYAISPDNLMFLDMYGHIEAARFLPSKYEQRSKLVPAADAGDIHVTAFDTQGKPVSNLAVYVRSLGSAREVYTDGNGQATIPAVPQGQQEVYAILTLHLADKSWRTLEAKTFVTVVPKSKTEAILRFKNPTKADSRRVHFYGTARVVNSENIGNNDPGNDVAYYAYCDLDTVTPDGRFGRTVVDLPNPGGGHLQMCNDEVGYKVMLSCELNDNHVVRVRVRGEIWEAESGSCGGDDHEDEGDQSFEFLIGAGQTQAHNMRSENHGAFGLTDYAFTTLNAANYEKP